MNDLEFGRTSYLIRDLIFGDSGKGTIGEFLTWWLDQFAPIWSKVHTVIRTEGGHQAIHNNILPDGRHHGFSQFGSGSLTSPIWTHHAKGMMVEPLHALDEGKDLQHLGVRDIFGRLTVSRDVRIVTPFQQAANRLREYARGVGRHGSCGKGIGETASDALVIGTDALYARDLMDSAILREKLSQIQAYKLAQLADLIYRFGDDKAISAEIDWLTNTAASSILVAYLGEFVERVKIVENAHIGGILSRPGSVIFEGAQGVLIDEWRGFHPYTTWSTCTFDNALELLREHQYDGRIVRIGVVRAYATRHGAGPFMTEDPFLTNALPDTYNVTDVWQQTFRVGWFDAVAARYAIAACGQVDALAVTCLDRMRDLSQWLICTGYELSEDDSNAAKFFELDPQNPRIARNIRLGPHKDLVYQETLTEQLKRVKPIYEVSANAADFGQRAEQHLARIESELGVPVAITSYGPTVLDKRMVRPV